MEGAQPQWKIWPATKKIKKGGRAGIPVFLVAMKGETRERLRS